MLKLNAELRNEARVALRGKWVMGAVATLVYMLVVSALSLVPVIGGLLSLLLSWAFAYGYYVLFYDVYTGKSDVEIGKIFDCFNDFSRIVGTGILVTIYVFLWSLLLVIPGIIKQYSYAMTPYIMKDNPEMKYNAAIEQSMQMMDGHKMRLFLLDLSFIGWWLLCFLTLGIGLFFLSPYVLTSRAAFYEDLKNELTGGLEMSVCTSVI